MSVLIDFFRKRLHVENKNLMLVIVGATGSGKSYTALKIAEELDPEFNIERVVFSAEEFMALLNSGKLHRGSVVVFDEGGVSLPAREWYSMANRLINYVLQTFRHKNLALIFTVPDLSFIDSQTRRLFHGYIETLAINRHNRYAIIKYLNMQPNPRFNKVYFKLPRTTGVNGEVVFNRVRVRLASPKLLMDYEAKKTTFTSKLNKGIENDLAVMRAKKKAESDEVKMSPEEIAAEVVKTPERFPIKKSANGYLRIDPEALCVAFGVGGRYGQRAKRLIESELNGGKIHTRSETNV